MCVFDVYCKACCLSQYMFSDEELDDKNFVDKVVWTTKSYFIVNRSRPDNDIFKEEKFKFIFDSIEDGWQGDFISETYPQYKFCSPDEYAPGEDNEYSGEIIHRDCYHYLLSLNYSDEQISELKANSFFKEYQSQNFDYNFVVQNYGKEILFSPLSEEGKKIREIINSNL